MAKRAKKKERRQVLPAPSAASPSVWAATWWKPAAGGIVIALAAVAVFSPTLHAPFYGDDAFYIFNNPLLKDPARLWKAWFEPGSFIEYYPIEQSVQWFQWLLFGDDTFGYHVCNLVLHIVNALLVWFFLGKLRLRFAWLGGLIYGIHPLFVDTVGGIAELKNTLSTGPFLLSMCFYIDYERRRKSGDYCLSLVFFLVAMLCKISMMFFPLVILLYAWHQRGRIDRQDLLRCAPFLFVSLVLGGLCLLSAKIYDTQIHDVPPGPILIGGFLSRFALIGLTLSFYLGHALLPLTPMPLYPLWKIDPPSLWQFLPWPVFAAAGWYLWCKRKTWGRHVILGTGAFVLFIVPTLGFINVSYMCLTWVQDHFLYLPILFLLALGLAGLEGICRLLPADLHRWVLGLMAAVVLLLAAEAQSYATLFSDTGRLFAYNAEYNPGSWFVHYTLGNSLLNQHRVEEGAAELELSLRINPDFVVARVRLGNCYFGLGEFAAAEGQFREAIRVDSSCLPAYTGMGAALTREGRFAESAAVFQHELKLAPGDAQAHDGLGTAYLRLGRNAEAIEEFKAAIDSAPQDGYALEELTRLNAN